MRPIPPTTVSPVAGQAVVSLWILPSSSPHPSALFLLLSVSPWSLSPRHPMVALFHQSPMLLSTCPSRPALTSPKPRCPFLPPFFCGPPLLSLSCIHMSGTSRAPVPNWLSMNLPTPSTFLVPGGLVLQVPSRSLGGDPPRRLLWICTPSRPCLLTPIVLWPSAKVQGVPSRMRTRIPIANPLRTIRERFRIFGTTAHIPGPVNKHGFMCGPKIFRAMEAAKNKDVTVKNTDTTSKNK